MRLVLNYYLGFLFFTLVLLSSCKAQKQGKMVSDELIQQDYIVTQIGEEDVTNAGVTLKVNPENSTISGNSGCNNYNFSYKLKGEKLDLGFASATKMYCKDAMKVENLFFQKAASVTQFDNSKNQILLKNKEGEILIKAKKQESSE